MMHNPPVVYMSYAPADEGYLDQFKAIAVEWELQGIAHFRSQGFQANPINQEAVLRDLTDVQAIIVLLSPAYLNTDFWEGNWLHTLFQEARQRDIQLFAVLAEPCEWKGFPFFQEQTIFSESGLALSQMSLTESEQQWARFADVVKNHLNQVKATANQLYIMRDGGMQLPLIDLNQAVFIGRKKALAWLNDCWANQQVTIATIIASAGVGKSMLVIRWLYTMVTMGFMGNARFFYWDFHDIDVSEEEDVSANTFIWQALVWAGVEVDVTAPLYQQGTALAEAVSKEPTLVLLEGLELQQYGLDAPVALQGHLKHPGLRAFITGLAQRQHQGLCVMTSRISLTDLTDWQGKQMLQLTLVPLAKEDTLNLKPHQNPAIRLNESHFEFLEQQALANTPALRLLYMVCMFFGPASKEEFEVLFNNGALRHLYEGMPAYGTESWQSLENKLIWHGLLHKGAGSVIVGPDVAQYFRQSFQHQYPEAYQVAHNVLYHRYYKQWRIQVIPPFIRKRASYHLAIGHGCQAGLHQQALNEVYYARLNLQGAYALHQMGAVQEELAALAHFFDQPWSQPSSLLNEADQAFVLHTAGLYLFAINHLEDALVPLQQSVAMNTQANRRAGATHNLGLLSSIWLCLGQVEAALENARHCVLYAGDAKDSFAKITGLAIMGNALFCQGNIEQAAQYFIDAEQHQAVANPSLPFLYAEQGYWYGKLLLHVGNTTAAEEGAVHALRLAQQHGWLLGQGLASLLLARLQLHQAWPEDSAQLTEQFDEAVSWLQQAGITTYLLEGLLYQAQFYRLLGTDQALHLALANLAEVYRIAGRGAQQLLLVHFHLEAAQVLPAARQAAIEWAGIDAKVFATPDQHVQTAESIMSKTGYRLPTAELSQIKAILA